MYDGPLTYKKKVTTWRGINGVVVNWDLRILNGWTSDTPINGGIGSSLFYNTSRHIGAVVIVEDGGCILGGTVIQHNYDSSDKGEKVERKIVAVMGRWGTRSACVRLG